jgi:hypothetical protein
MKALYPLIGRERSQREVALAASVAARAQRASLFGALQVTCSDETEGACVEAFHQGFVQHLLPPLRFGQRAAFRIANLGGRYEWGAVRIANAHFVAPEASETGKLLMVKVNAHVACEELPAMAVGAGVEADRPFRLGTLRRYGHDTPCCGALEALVSDAREPWLEELREAFGSEGRDRLAALRDERVVDPKFAPLHTALVSARLQARKIVIEIQDQAPTLPAYYAVLASVSINRPDRSSEIPCGIYTLDGRAGRFDTTYYGLGDDPAAYAASMQSRLLVVSDDQLGSERTARDHRALARDALRRHAREGKIVVHDGCLDRVRREVAQNKHRSPHHAKALLRAALPILAEVAPVPAAIIAFAEGAAGIHHAFRVHKLAQQLEGTTEARQILDDLHRRIDGLDGDRARALVELLVRDYA